MTLAAELPPFPVLDAALRRTTERLARELHAPTTVAPSWSRLEWSVACAVSAMQGISVLLGTRLRWRGPDSWQTFLATQATLGRQRDAHIEKVIAGIDVAMRAHGVPCVALKGSALRRLGLYRCAERPMGDVDLLIRPDAMTRAARALHDVHYVPSFNSRRHQAFEPRDKRPATGYGEHPDNPLKIEVHTAISEPLPTTHVDITAALSTPGAPPGINAYPADRELMRHLLLHAAGNIRAQALRQVQLHDISLLAARLDESDWQRLLQTPGSQGGCWWMWPALALTHRYYPGALPTMVDAFRKRCPPLLRAATARSSLRDVSWSNLDIAAFPGMCWSRSPLEAARFARSRFWPDRVALDELSVVHTAQPQLDQVPWYGVSHVERIARWLFTRPPRVQTIVTVSAVMQAERLS